MELLIFLILFPLIIAGLIKIAPGERITKAAVLAGASVVAVSSLGVLATSLAEKPEYFSLPVNYVGVLI